MALIENIQREDLNPIEEAVALQRLQQEFQLTQQQVADAVGKSRVTMSNLLRLDCAAGRDQDHVVPRRSGNGPCPCVARLPADQQVEGARHVVARGLTVRQTEALVRQWLSKQSTKTEPKSLIPISSVSNSAWLSVWALPVQIKHGKKGKGQLVIGYSSLDELAGCTCPHSLKQSCLCSACRKSLPDS
jgi:ParB family transcriptional regulator, chromosome partitioning protein